MTDAATPPDAAPRPPRPLRSARAVERATAFDDFYKDSRDRLLVQTVALTGDLTAARSAVRDAFVVAWHHWRKIARQESAEDVVRGYAYRFGLRRRSARPFARRKDGDDEARATLDALAGISLPQRKAVILTQLAGVDMPQAAREIGVPVDSAERELAAGAALFAHDRGIGTGQIHDTLVRLEAMTRSVTWPRATIIRRAGAARRRAHTLIGAAGAVAIFAAAGAIVTDGTGLRPTLDRDARTLAASHSSAPPEVTLPESGLLTAASLAQGLHDKGWGVDSTTDNSSGNGLAQPCQNTRYADPKGAAAYVRRFHTGKGARTQTYVQSAEASNSEAAAHRAYANALAWFTTCAPPAGQSAAKLPQVHLVSTATAPGLGDESAVVVLQMADPSATYVVGLARTGQFVTATSLGLPRADPHQVGRQPVAGLLGTAVDRLCALPDGGACAPKKVTVKDAPAYPVGSSASLLSEIDLPPFATSVGRLVGTTPREVVGDRSDANVVGCDVVHLVKTYAGAEIRTNLIRSFVFVGSQLPKETGLTQVVGTLPLGRSAGFVKQMTAQVAKCPKSSSSLGTDETPLASRSTRSTDLRAWRMTTELPGHRSVNYDVAVVRNGEALSQVIYVSAPRAQMADRDFVDLADRALERLTELPSYKDAQQ